MRLALHQFPGGQTVIGHGHLRARALEVHGEQPALVGVVFGDEDFHEYTTTRLRPDRLAR